VLTAGVDLAPTDERTTLATIAWSRGRAVLRDLTVGVPDARIVAAVRAADKTGLNCALGWPEPFAALINAHRVGHTASLPSDDNGANWRRALMYRATDEAVRATVAGVVPPSVAADRQGQAALRCAALQAMLARAGQDVDRSGSGAIVETYPAASLYGWGLTRRYNGRHLDLATTLREATAPWLDLGPHADLVAAGRAAFDAVVAALTARATALGFTLRPDADQLPLARIEGWIAVPSAGLERLPE
jgi:predicted nuclease with RNAse H fold